MYYIQLFLESFLEMFIDMAFYIMLGLFFVGILNTYVKRDKVLKHLGSEKFSSVVKASLVGVPLPLCSCGVVPTALELKRSGASNGAVVSFLMSTPQTGVDSIAATYSMMGWLMAIYRPIAAFISGIVGGAVVNLLAKNEVIHVDAYGGSCCSSKGETTVASACGCSAPEQVEETSCCCSSSAPEKVEVSSCCCSGSAPEKVEETSCCCSGSAPEQVEETSCCCSGSAPEQVEETSCCCSSSAPEKVEETSCCCSGTGTPVIKNKFSKAMHYAFVEFLDEIAGHFLVGMVLASLISAFVPADFFINLGLNNGIFAMISMVLIGVPMYICSTSSIPIAISLVGKGLSLGSGFVFLFTGPVTNIASILVLSKVLGKKITTLYLSLVITCSIFFGLLLDTLLGQQDLEFFMAGGMSHHGEGLHLLYQGVAVAFALLLCGSFARRMKQEKHG